MLNGCFTRSTCTATYTVKSIYALTNHIRMTISYKFVLDKRRLKPNNIYPLKLRVFQQGRFKEKSTGILLHDSAWDEKQQAILPRDKAFKKNSFILNSLKTRIERIIMLAEDSTEYLTPDILLNKLHKQPERKADIKLVEYADTLINNLKTANRAGTALAYRDAVNSLTSYGGKNLLIKDITYRLLEDYNSCMLSKGVKVNSIAAYLRSIRAIYNRAIKEGIAELQHYPFNRFKIETEDTFSRTLTVEEMKMIVDANLPPDTPIWHNRNYFLLSFYLIGINFTDLFTLTEDDITDGTVRYRRDKTGKLYSIGISEEAKSIISYYRQYKSNNGHKYLLPALQVTADSMQQKRWMKQIVKTNNQYLKEIAGAVGIAKNITTYYARYTWANIAKQLGYSKDMIAEALGHEYGNQVTGIYLDKYDGAVIDEMNNRVIRAIE